MDGDCHHDLIDGGRRRRSGRRMDPGAQAV